MKLQVVVVNGMIVWGQSDAIVAPLQLLCIWRCLPNWEIIHAFIEPGMRSYLDPASFQIIPWDVLRGVRSIS